MAVTRVRSQTGYSMTESIDRCGSENNCGAALARELSLSNSWRNHALHLSRAASCYSQWALLASVFVLLPSPCEQQPQPNDFWPARTRQFVEVTCPQGKEKESAIN